MQYKVFEEWQNKLENDYPNMKKVGNLSTEELSSFNIGLKISHDEVDFSVLIEISETYPYPYFGLSNQYSNEIKEVRLDIINEIKNDGGFHENAIDWYLWKPTNIEDGYVELKNLIEQVLRFYDTKPYGF